MMVRVSTLKKRPSLVRSILLGENPPRVRIDTLEELRELDAMGLVERVPLSTPKWVVVSAPTHLQRKLSAHRELVPTIVRFGNRELAEELSHTSEYLRALYHTRPDVPEEEVVAFAQEATLLLFLETLDALLPTYARTKRVDEAIVARFRELGGTPFRPSTARYASVEFLEEHIDTLLKDAPHLAEILLERELPEHLARKCISCLDVEAKRTLLQLDTIPDQTLKLLAEGDDPSIRRRAWKILNRREESCHKKDF